MSIFKSSVSFVFALAVLAFVAAFSATIRNDGEPSESDKLDVANEAISGLVEQNVEMHEKVQYFASQLEILADRQNETVKLNRGRWEEVEEFSESHRAQLANIEKNQAEFGEGLEKLAEGQKELVERAEEKLDVLAERFDFGDARMREIAAAQEDFAELGEKIRTSTAFKKVARVDLDDIGRALSNRIDMAMKSRQKLTADEKKKLNLLTKRRSQLQRLIYDSESNTQPQTERPEKKMLNEAEQILAKNYENEIAELESAVSGLEIKTSSSFDGRERELQLVLAKVEEEYTVIFNQRFQGSDQRVLYHDPEFPVIDLTPEIIQMIQGLEDDDPILAEE